MTHKSSIEGIRDPRNKLRRDIAFHLDALQIMGENHMGDLPKLVAADFHCAVGYLSDVHDWLVKESKSCG
jgi:hypothetical protein